MSGYVIDWSYPSPIITTNIKVLLGHYAAGTVHCCVHLDNSDMDLTERVSFDVLPRLNFSRWQPV